MVVHLFIVVIVSVFKKRNAEKVRKVINYVVEAKNYIVVIENHVVVLTNQALIIRIEINFRN